MAKKSTALVVRYIIMSVHLLLWLVILPISLVFTGNSVLVIVHAAAGLALVIYVPAAIILSAKNSWNQFDHAGGEVAYIVIQMLAWLIGGAIGIVLRVVAIGCGAEQGNYGPDYVYDNYYLVSCDVTIAIAALSFVQVFLMIAWLWIVVLYVHRAPGHTASQAYTIPTHRLLTSQFGVESIDMYAQPGFKPSIPGQARGQGQGNQGGGVGEGTVVSPFMMEGGNAASGPQAKPLLQGQEGYDQSAFYSAQQQQPHELNSQQLYDPPNQPYNQSYDGPSHGESSNQRRHTQSQYPMPDYQPQPTSQSPQSQPYQTLSRQSHSRSQSPAPYQSHSPAPYQLTTTSGEYAPGDYGSSTLHDQKPVISPTPLPAPHFNDQVQAGSQLIMPVPSPHPNITAQDSNA